jgi:predicted nucleotidyltransferase
LEKRKKQFAIDTISNYFSKFKDILAVYLYGSVARNSHTQSSDVDILTFWNYHILDSADIKNMKEELTKLDLTYYK